MEVLEIVNNPARDQWKALISRPSLPSEKLDETVRAILADVKLNGEMALRKYSLQFEQVAISNFLVPDAEYTSAGEKVDEKLRAAIRQAKQNIEKFHRSQLYTEPVVETMPGIFCWRKSVPIDKVGLYIPGGSAPLFSTLLMLGIPATIAGCAEIIVCTPPQKDGTVHPAILFTASLLGIRKIFKLGGVQAIGAMSFGTTTIPLVYKIFGPGNQWVTQAKKIIQQEGVAIDMPAGPSELAIYADESAIPDFVAADLLSQCEHGPDSQVLLVTGSQKLADEVNLSIERQLAELPRKSIAAASLTNSRIIIIDQRTIAMDLLNLYAPEHLILGCTDAEVFSSGVRNAGSVFIGNYAPESAGDYATGTNHTLPTNGYAKAYSGVSVDSFMKKISFQKLTERGLRTIGPAIIEMAVAEGLDAHAAAISIRLKMESAINDLYERY